MTEEAAAAQPAVLTAEELRKLEETFDSEVRFRPQSRPVLILAGTILFGLSCYHFYTSGFGIPPLTTHTGVHMGFTLALIFMAFTAFHTEEGSDVALGMAIALRVLVGLIVALYLISRVAGPFQPNLVDLLAVATLVLAATDILLLVANRASITLFGLPVWDWLLAIAGLISALYVPWIYSELAFRVGNPLPIDLIMGTTLIVILLEAVRRSMGWPLPVIAILFMAYAYWGRSMPGMLIHPGASWSGIVNHLYLTSQGIYGTALRVISTYVFHFVLFGVLATRIGLGQLFIDLASAVAGRFAGGPAKVSVLSSALLGSISGSSIANTVTTGSLTIPAMIRIGYPRHFAAAVEAASSTGGQITPPVMGAVAFLMIEYLGVPLTTILTAALVPAFMHFFGVLTQVHLEARRRGLRGLTKEELPDVWKVLKEGWLTIVPLIVLVSVLLSGMTPYAAAFWGITSCIGVLVIQSLWTLPLREAVVAVAKGVFDGFVLGAKYSLSVTAAAALVGVIIGVVTLTGVGFKIAYMVTGLAADWAGSITSWLAWMPFEIMDQANLTLLLTLILTAVVCILMGAGIPTTANYLIMIAVAAPILGLLGVQPLVAHFFVFYYGVLADITPPVALAAYAAAGIANCNAFKAGNTAFRLGMGKVLVPFVFAFSPSLLLVVDGFTWSEFFLAAGGAMLGIWALSAAFAGWLLGPVHAYERPLLAVAAMLLVAPNLVATLVGLGLIAPVAIRQLAGIGRRSVA